MIRRPPVPWRRRALIFAPLLAAGAATGVLATQPSSSARPQASTLEVQRVFAAVGGRIVAQVTVSGERQTPVELMDRTGVRLAAGVAGPAPLTLEGQAARGDRVAVILHPSVKRGFSWEVAATGLVQPGNGLSTG